MPREFIRDLSNQLRLGMAREGNWQAVQYGSSMPEHGHSQLDVLHAPARCSATRPGFIPGSVPVRIQEPVYNPGCSAHVQALQGDVQLQVSFLA